MKKIEPEILAENPVTISRVRRHWLLGLVAVVAATSGVILAWKKIGFGSLQGMGQEWFWRSSFLTPGGTLLAMASFQGRPLILNFWATWCPPCVEEFHLLDVFYKENVVKGWQILGLALDQPNSVQRFLVQSPVAFPIAIAGLDGAALGKSLGNSTGGLPFTVVFDSDGLIRHLKIGQLSEQDLKAWLAMMS